MNRHSRIVMAWALLISLASPALAEKVAQPAYQDKLREAQQSHSLAVLLMQGAAVVLGLMLLYGAWSVARGGLKISKEKTMEGPAAVILASLLGLAGVGAIMAAFLYVPSLGP